MSALHATDGGAPWLAPSTTLRAPGEGIVVTRVRLPTVAESAELQAAGWTPVLGRLGVWADDSGDSWGRWWTWALEIARRDRSRAGADGGGGRAVAPRCATSGRSVPTADDRMAEGVT